VNIWRAKRIRPAGWRHLGAEIASFDVSGTIGATAVGMRGKPISHVAILANAAGAEIVGVDTIV